MPFGTPSTNGIVYGSGALTPPYPNGVLSSDVVLLFIGQKPGTANGGSVTTPTGWTLREQLTGAGGYGTTLGIDTGNTNLFIYSWNTPVAGQTGQLIVSLSDSNSAWAFIVRIPTSGGAISYGSADGQQATTPGTSMSVPLTNGTPATNFENGDLAFWAMCIATDLTTPNQFSAHSITATGATFGTVTELNEPDSSGGNDVAGYSAYALVTAGSSTANPTIGATLAGTLTNVRGPVCCLRIREAPVPSNANFLMFCI